VLYLDWDVVAREAIAAVAAADVAMVTSYCPDGPAASQLVLENAAGATVFYDLDTPVALAKLDSGERPAYLPADGLTGFDLVLSYTGGAALSRPTPRVDGRGAPLRGRAAGLGRRALAPALVSPAGRIAVPAAGVAPRMGALPRARPLPGRDGELRRRSGRLAALLLVGTDASSPGPAPAIMATACSWPVSRPVPADCWPLPSPPPRRRSSASICSSCRPRRRS
jgi:hypothetical protein